MKPPPEKADGVAAIQALLAKVNALAHEARQNNDVPQQRNAIERRWCLLRRGGQLLLSGQRPPAKLGRHTNDRMRALGRMSDIVFEAALRRAVARQLGGAGSSPGAIVMRVTAFKRDEFGCLSRSIFAVDRAPASNASRADAPAAP